MTRSTDELIRIKDLPDFLRTNHCYNDLQHAMLVILFRHALTAMKNGDERYADQLMDTVSLYLYIHFLNEEEGMVFNLTRGFIDRDGLAEHSEMHVKFLDLWKTDILLPYKRRDVPMEQTLEKVRKYYNVIIKHIDGTDQHMYGAHSDFTVEQVRSELARIAQTKMPMSPYMAGAYDTVKCLDLELAAALDHTRMSPVARQPLGALDLIPGVGRVLSGGMGSLRDRFAAHAAGDRGAQRSSARIYTLHAA